MNQHPAPVKYAYAYGVRYIERREARRAERRDEQRKLEIGHAGAMNIKCLHHRFPSL
jgi:hypothetical protein